MKHRLLLDDAPLFEGWAFLLFRASYPAYTFADILNRLYDYRLTRTDDLLLTLSTAKHQAANTEPASPWPLFLHHDPVRHLQFFLTEQTATAAVSPWAVGDKLLIVRGDIADQVVSTIHRDFNTTPAYDEGDILAKEHAQLLDSLIKNFTVAIPLDFETEPVSPKAIKERKLNLQYCNAILDYIETHRLDLSPDERFRLSANL